MDVARSMSCHGPGREEYDKKKRSLLAALFGAGLLRSSGGCVGNFRLASELLGVRCRAFYGECKDHNHRTSSDDALKNRDQFHGELPCY
jgi:hypothetical protein